jgi:hypothetical protein
MRPIYKRTKDGSQVVLSPFEGRTGRTQFSVEIVKDGEVVDHYELFDKAAVDHMTEREGWKPWRKR